MDSNLIFGIRPVAEAIEAGKQIEKLYIRKGAEGQLMQELKDLCMIITGCCKVEGEE